MEDILESLTTSTRISLEDDDISLVHPRYAQYKPKRALNQEERRRRWLLEQKEKRLDTFIVNRNIEDCGDDSSDEEPVKMVEGEEAQAAEKEKKKKERAECPYKNWLMLSYWLVDVPENFLADWYYKMCPKGRRAIVVANKGTTVAYSRRGAFMMKFLSTLPGGNPSSYNPYTVIDCVFCFSTQTYYILDVLIWGIPLTNCSAELRFFWLVNKFAEYPELEEVSDKNRHKFKLVRHEMIDTLPEAMMTHPTFENNDPQVDGVLFYQKEALYTGGKSPLVVWLKPFMVKDILSIPVDENYIKEIPANYPSKLTKMETETTPEESTAEP